MVRRFGGFAIRHDLVDVVPKRLARMNEERHRLLTRRLRPEELTMPDGLRERLNDLFRPDLERLASLADATAAPDVARWSAR